MYSARPGLLIGFHGCDEAFRDAVINGKTAFRPSTDKYDWLGHGIYFWENNVDRALQFAQELRDHPRRSGPRIATPSVLGAVIDLRHCLDLVDSRYLSLLQSSHENLRLAYTARHEELPVNKAPTNTREALIRELDCAVIENVHKRNEAEPFDSVRGVFVEGDPLYESAGFHEKNHIQICVRNPNCIKGFFLPRKEVVWP